MKFASSHNKPHVSLKILHIITGLSTGGAELALFKLIEAGDRQHFEHCVVSLIDTGTQGKKLKQLGVAVYALGIKGFWSFFRGVYALRIITKNYFPDVTHGWMYHGGLFALMAGSYSPKILGIRHSLHDLKQDKRATRALIKILAFFSKKFRAVVFNSMIGKQQHESIGYSRANSIYINNGFDCQMFHPRTDAQKTLLKNKFSIPSEAFVIGSVGRYHVVKNHIGLLKAFSGLLKHNSNIMLVLAGRDIVDSNPVLQKHINTLKLNNKVILLGERDDIGEILNIMDCYTSSSHAESFPNVIGEAMASGVPCIATDVGDSAYIIGGAGFVVPPNDTDALAKAMLKAASLTEEERRALGRKARQRIVENFQQEKVTQAYEELYRKLAK